MPRGKWKECRTCKGTGKILKGGQKVQCTACKGKGGIYTGLV